MKLAIKKIEYIPSANIRSFKHLSENASCDIESLIITDSFTELLSTQETFTLAEQWNEDSLGRFSSVEVSFSIRSSLSSALSVLSSLSKNKFIYLITAVNGEKLLVGSPEFRATLLYSKGISGLSTYQFNVVISCKSTHGIIYATSE